MHTVFPGAAGAPGASGSGTTGATGSTGAVRSSGPMGPAGPAGAVGVGVPEIQERLVQLALDPGCLVQRVLGACLAQLVLQDLLNHVTYRSYHNYG